jgi:hypothetical protein
MVQLLLDFHADPEMKDRYNQTPLYFYLRRGDTAAMRAVLQRGVKVDPISQDPYHKNRMALDIVAWCSNVDAVKLLLEFGADVHLTDGCANTPLHLAAITGEIEVVKLLVKRWPEGVKAENNCWDTPLRTAVKYGRTEVVRFLVDGWPESIRVKNHYGCFVHAVALCGCSGGYGANEVLGVLLVGKRQCER